MNVEIIKDENGAPIGWTMSGENKEEIAKLCDVRNLQFFGYDDTAIEYNGREGGDDKAGNPGTLSWIQDKHRKK